MSCTTSIENRAASPTPWTFDRQVLAGLAILIGLVSAYIFRQADPDLWGHLRYGQFFTEHGTGTADPFAYTSTGLTWYGHEHLAQRLLWYAYSLGGVGGLLALKCLVGGGALVFLYLGIRQGSQDARIWAPVFILSAGIVGRWFQFRPQLFTFLFFAYFVWVLLRFLLHERRRLLWTLPLVLAVWANMHGGFLAGIGAVGLTLLLRTVQAGRRHRWNAAALWRDCWPLLLVLAGCAAASLCNPLGARLWIYLLTEMTHDTNRRYIAEWRPLDPRTELWSTLTIGLLLLMLLFAGVLAQVRRRADRTDASADAATGRSFGLPPWLWLLSCLPLTVMMLQSVRHLPVLALWTAPVAALLAQTAAGEGRLWQRGWLLLTGLTLVPAFLTVWFLATWPAPQIRIGPTVFGETHPWGAIRFLRANHIQGNVYAPLWWGSCLTWELYPDIKVAMDGRNVTLFPVGLVKENLRYFLEGPEQLKDAPLRHDTDLVLIPRDSPALKWLQQDDRWAEIYSDEAALLLVRRDAAHAELLQRARSGELTRPAVVIPEYFE